MSKGKWPLPKGTLKSVHSTLSNKEKLITLTDMSSQTRDLFFPSFKKSLKIRFESLNPTFFLFDPICRVVQKLCW